MSFPEEDCSHLNKKKTNSEINCEKKLKVLEKNVDKKKHFTIHEKLIELKRVFNKKQKIDKIKLAQKIKMLETKNNKRDKLRNIFLSTSNGYVDSITCPIGVNYLVSPHAETAMPDNPHLQSLPDAAFSSSQVSERCSSHHESVTQLADSETQLPSIIGSTPTYSFSATETYRQSTLSPTLSTMTPHTAQISQGLLKDVPKMSVCCLGHKTHQENISSSYQQINNYQLSPIFNSLLTMVGSNSDNSIYVSDHFLLSKLLINFVSQQQQQQQQYSQQQYPQEQYSQEQYSQEQYSQQQYSQQQYPQQQYSQQQYSQQQYSQQQYSQQQYLLQQYSQQQYSRQQYSRQQYLQQQYSQQQYSQQQYSQKQYSQETQEQISQETTSPLWITDSDSTVYLSNPQTSLQQFHAYSVHPEVFANPDTEQSFQQLANSELQPFWFLNLSY